MIDDWSIHKITSLVSDCLCHSEMSFIIKDNEGSRMQTRVPQNLHLHNERRKIISTGWKQFPQCPYACLLYRCSCWRHVESAWHTCFVRIHLSLVFGILISIFTYQEARSDKKPVHILVSLSTEAWWEISPPLCDGKCSLVSLFRDHQLNNSRATLGCWLSPWSWVLNMTSPTAKLLLIFVFWWTQQRINTFI